MAVATTLIPATNSTAIIQSTTAGVPFDGLAPAGASPLVPVQDATGIWRYAAGAHAGLVRWNNNEPILCSQLYAKFNGAVAWSLTLVNLDADGVAIAGESWVLRSGTAALVQLDESNFKIVLLARQALQLVSAAVGGQVQSVIAVASIERTFTR